MRPIWPEAEIVAEPMKLGDEPRVLVRRKFSGLVGPDVDVAFFEGAPAISLFTGCVRYFPDRDFICNPDPTGHDDGRSKAFVNFFRELRQKEPDRIVCALQ